MANRFEVRRHADGACGVYDCEEGDFAGFGVGPGVRDAALRSVASQKSRVEAGESRSLLWREWRAPESQYAAEDGDAVESLRQKLEATRRMIKQQAETIRGYQEADEWWSVPPAEEGWRLDKKMLERVGLEVRVQLRRKQS